MAIDCADKNATRYAQRFIAYGRQKFFRGQYLATLYPVNVGNDALDLVDLVLGYPVGKVDSHRMLCAQTGMITSSQPAHIILWSMAVR